MKLTNQQIRMMQEETTAQLVELLVRDRHLSVEEGLDVVYNSETYEKLMDTSTGLYSQSAGYVYSFLSNEQEYGRMG